MVSDRLGVDRKQLKATLPPIVGAVAQLGERCVRNAEVRGSIPLGSTLVGIAAVQKSAISESVTCRGVVRGCVVVSWPQACPMTRDVKAIGEVPAL